MLLLQSARHYHSPTLIIDQEQLSPHQNFSACHNSHDDDKGDNRSVITDVLCVSTSPRSLPWEFPYPALRSFKISSHVLHSKSLTSLRDFGSFGIILSHVTSPHVSTVTMPRWAPRNCWPQWSVNVTCCFSKQQTPSPSNTDRGNRWIHIRISKQIQYAYGRKIVPFP